ncbi:hypothetical protein EVAR_53405_1 [Eumeta japonica]|uniref:Uncharacterized protein n=1 Tax=Eumeta variegata TaxID=151549 RepID=A0A4C1XQP2_EUMVA|nr:hypothetical protein EVAR_53405_1 [Eumeta japonica]
MKSIPRAKDVVQSRSVGKSFEQPSLAKEPELLEYIVGISAIDQREADSDLLISPHLLTEDNTASLF